MVPGHHIRPLPLLCLLETSFLIPFDGTDQQSLSVYEVDGPSALSRQLLESQGAEHDEIAGRLSV